MFELDDGFKLENIMGMMPNGARSPSSDPAVQASLASGIRPCRTSLTQAHYARLFSSIVLNGEAADRILWAKEHLHVI
jgi:hypothetical protein